MDEDVAAVWSLYVPESQSEHCVLPDSEEYLPCSQSRHSVAEINILARLPFEHAVQLVSPTPDIVPAMHSSQDVARASLFAILPATHSVQLTQPSSEYLPD
jgi:hypothetical protein